LGSFYAANVSIIEGKNMKELQLVTPDGGLVLPEETKEQLKSIIRSGIADATLKSYHKDITYFWTWANIRTGREEDYPIEPELVLMFLTDHFAKMPDHVEDQMIQLGIKKKRGPLKYATIKRRLFTISAFHTKQGLKNPCKHRMVIEVMSKARKAMILQGVEIEKKAPAVKHVIAKLIATCGDSLVDLRDKAIILLAFSSGGRRRSEVANFRVEDLETVQGGYTIRMYHSKSDFSGKPKTFPVIGQAGIALQVYLDATNITTGPLFRYISRHGTIHDGLSGIGIHQIFKKRCQMAGLDEKLFGSRSLRSGFVTECINQGIGLHEIKKLTNHASFKSLEDYAIGVSVTDSPAAKII
jgi:site-specific recombinase XerD